MCLTNYEHNVIGDSMADNVMDLQDVETQITRQMLNNMVAVNNPRRKAVKDNYDRQSVVDNKWEGIIEVSSPDALTWDHTPFVGDKCLLVREAFNETRAERTGISKESMGLAAQNLQASSEVGVLAVLGAGQTQPEMIAATMAHRAFVPLARKILALLKEDQTGEMAIRKAGQTKMVNPKDWPDDMELEVMVGLGTGTRQENLVALQMIKQEQKEILLTLGPENPLCTMEQYAHTCSRIAQLTGVGPSTSFFNSPDMVKILAAQMKQQAAMQPPPPDPKMEKVKADARAKAMKIQSDAQLGEKKLALDARQKAQEAQTDAQAGIYKTNVEVAAGREESQMELALERWRAEAELQQQATLRALEMAMEERLSIMEMQMQERLGKAQQADTNIDRQ